MAWTYRQIAEVVRRRWESQTPVIAWMEQVRRRANGDLVIPMPDVEGEPALPPLTPLLVANAINRTAMRAASVRPNIWSPALNEGRERGPGSRTYASLRSHALTATLDASYFGLVRRRYYRHLVGYATAALTVHQCTDGPRVRVVNPLGAFPSPRAPEDLSDLDDIGFVSEMTSNQIRRRWPHAASEVGGPVKAGTRGDSETWLIFEWQDPEQIMWGLLGPKWTGIDYQSFDAVAWQSWDSPLEVLPNRAEMVCTVCPQQVTLDALASRVSQVIGISDLMGRLLQLDVVAQEKAIFPDRYIIATPTGTPRIQGGRWHDGREGDTNVLTDVAQVGELRSTPDMRTYQTLQMLERNFNNSTDQAPPMAGEGGSYAARTGRGIDTMLTASIDQTVQELHEMSEAFLPTLLKGVIRTYRGWYGTKTFSMASSWGGRVVKREFQVDPHLTECDDAQASYAIAGADVQALTVAIGQLLGAKLLSADTASRMHPWIPEGERARINEEDVEDAVRQAILQQVVSGQVPITYAVRIEAEVRKGYDIIEAVTRVDNQIREEQAAIPPEPEDDQMEAPEMMPGLQGAPVPGGGVMQPPPPTLSPDIQPPNANQENLRLLLQRLSAQPGPGTQIPANV